MGWPLVNVNWVTMPPCEPDRTAVPDEVRQRTGSPSDRSWVEMVYEDRGSRSIVVCFFVLLVCVVKKSKDFEVVVEVEVPLLLVLSSLSYPLTV